MTTDEIREGLTFALTRDYYERQEREVPDESCILVEKGVVEAAIELCEQLNMQDQDTEDRS